MKNEKFSGFVNIRRFEDPKSSTEAGMIPGRICSAEATARSGTAN